MSKRRIKDEDKLTLIKPIFPEELGMRGLLLIIMMTLASCSSASNRQSGYGNVLDSWIGAREEKLISQWGPPANSYTSGNTTSLSYIYNGGVQYIPPIRTNIGIMGGGAVPVNCMTNFTLVNHIITSWSFNGNGCPT